METTKRDFAIPLPSPFPEPVAVVWVGAEGPPRRLRELLAERGLALTAATGGRPAVTAGLLPQGVVVCFGPGCSADEVRGVLDDLGREAPEAACSFLVLRPDGAGDLAGFQDLIDDDRLFYLSRGSLSARDLAGLIESAAASLRRPDLSSPLAPRGAQAGLPVDILRRLALARVLPELAEGIGAAILAACSAQRGRCLLFDSSRQALWNPAEGDEPDSGESPAVGLASFILRTGLTLCLPHAGDDPRFDGDLDNPGGDPASRFLGVPMRSGGPGGEIRAVLVALRDPQEPPFEPRDAAALEAVAAHAVPFLTALAPEADPSPELRGPFRERALQEREMLATPREPLRLAPGWTSWTFWLMVAAFVAIVVALGVVEVPEYASGVAVVRAGGRVEVTATAGGTVSALAVQPGDRVSRGQVLLTLYSAEEAASLRRLDRELESKLVQRLQAPSDPVVAQDLLALRSERELAQSRLSERELRAPEDGEVSDLRAAPGQLLQAGQPVLSILARRELPSVIALLPGSALPQIRPGMRMRLELPGHPYVYRWLVLGSVAGEVIGPAEARRLLGPVAGDTVPLEGPLAVVTAPLPASTFEVDGKTYEYRDGMPSRAEVLVKSQRLLFALMPALKSLESQDGGGHG